jgi:VanZ family protein
MLAIWFLSSQSGLPLPKGIFGVDKIAHCIAYATLAAAWALFFLAGKRTRAWSPWLIWAVAFSVSLGYGALDEFHQSFVPGRDASVFDLLADGLGAAAGAGIIARFSSRLSFCLQIRPSSGTMFNN